MKKPNYACLLMAIAWLPALLSAQHHPLYEALALRPYFIQTAPGKAVILNDESTLRMDSITEAGIRTTKKVLRSNVQEILASYCGGSDKVNQENINKAFDNDNPFMILEYTSNFDLKADKLGSFGREEAIPSSGNPVSTIADGLARFLVKRTKEELTQAFFADFKQAVQDDKKGYFRHFFRNTQQILLVMDTEVYQFQIYLETLREAFIADLRVLPGNLSNYLREAPVKIIKPAQQSIAVDLFDVVQMTMDGQPTLDLIRYLANDSISAIQTSADTLPALKNLSAGLHLVNQVSESLLSPETGGWYTENEIKKALADPITFRLYLGLLWHNSLKIKAVFKNNLSINQLIAKAAVAPNLFNDWRESLIIFGENVADLKENIGQRDDNSGSFSDNFANCILIFNRILETANTLNTALNPDAGTAIESKYLQLIQQIGALNFNARQKRYSAAVGNTVVILNTLLDSTSFQGARDVLLKYGMFIAAVAEADNADEVQNALELFALPPGSSKAKKVDGTFSVALNAYTGFNVSGENYRRPSIPNSSHSATSAGIAAPVGFSVNWGRNWGSAAKPKNGSIGFFFPVVDVGAIFAYRFQENGVENLPPLEWKNIISPGAYLVVDPPLGKWPLTIGLGGQLGPLLRKVEDNGAYVNRDVVGYRIGGFATLDIPINYLKLKTKGK